MKRFLSIVTLSLLASTTMVQSKFNVNEHIDDENIINNGVYIQIAKLRDKENRAEGPKKALFKNERVALENLFQVHYGKKLYESGLRMYNLSCLEADLNDDFSLNSLHNGEVCAELTLNETFMRIYKSVKETKNPIEKKWSEVILSILTANMQKQSPDKVIEEQVKTLYLGANKLRKSAVLKLNEQSASKAEILERLSYLQYKERLLGHVKSVSFAYDPGILVDYDREFLLELLSNLTKKKKEKIEARQKKLQKANGKKFKADNPNIVESDLEIVDDKTVKFNGKTLSQNEQLNYEIQEIKVDFSQFETTIKGLNKTKKGKPAKYIAIDYKNNTTAFAEIGNEGVFSLSRENAFLINLKTFNRKQFTAVVIDEDLNFNFVVNQYIPLSFVRNARYIESAINMITDNCVFERESALTKNVSLGGEVHSTYSGEKVLKIEGWSAADKGEPAKFVTVFYDKKVMGAFEVGKDEIPETTGIPMIKIPPKSYFSGEVYLYNLNEDFDPKLLKVVGLDDQNKYNFLKTSTLPTPVKQQAPAPKETVVKTTDDALRIKAEKKAARRKAALQQAEKGTTSPSSKSTPADASEQLTKDELLAKAAKKAARRKAAQLLAEKEGASSPVKGGKAPTSVTPAKTTTVDPAKKK